MAFYPGCVSALQRADYRPTLPLLILQGGADDWTPAAPCVALGQKLKAGGLPVHTVVYPDALHGFDLSAGQSLYLPDVYNPGAPGGRGAHVGGQPKARLAAIEEVRTFLRRTLAP